MANMKGAGLDQRIRSVSSGSKSIASSGTKYLYIDSGKDGAEILSITVKGVVGADWTLDIYIPAEDGASATQAGDKRDTIEYVNTDTEAGQLVHIKGFPYDMYIDFTNDSGGSDDIDDVIIMYKSTGTLTTSWEA